MKEIKLTQNKCAIVDDCDFENIKKHKWFFYKVGYAGRCVHVGMSNGKQVNRVDLMHRVILGAKKGEEVDHVNGDKLDNRRINIRICSSSQNKQNLQIKKNNTSGYKGVSHTRRPGVWRAYIGFCKKRYELGKFKTREAAARAYDAKAKEFFGEFARLNFPEK